MDDAERLSKLYTAKAKAELKDADKAFGAPVAVAGSGEMLGSVVLVKGTPGDEDRSARRALAGPDGEAVIPRAEALPEFE